MYGKSWLFKRLGRLKCALLTEVHENDHMTHTHRMKSSESHRKMLHTNVRNIFRWLPVTTGLTFEKIFGHSLSCFFRLQCSYFDVVLQGLWTEHLKQLILSLATCIKFIPQLIQLIVLWEDRNSEEQQTSGHLHFLAEITRSRVLSGTQ